MSSVVCVVVVSGSQSLVVLVVGVGFVGFVDVDVDFVDVDVWELVEVGVDVVVGGPLLNLRRKLSFQCRPVILYLTCTPG